MGRHIKKPPKEAFNPDKVGYRNPPKKHQFRKGQSGNPNGRPKGSKGLKTDLKQVLGTIRTIVINGQEISGRTQWLMLEALAMRGSYGDLKATAQLLPLVLQVLGIEDRDVDANRLSDADDAMLERLLNRWGPSSREAKPKLEAKRKAKSAPGKRAAGGEAGKANA